VSVAGRSVGEVRWGSMAVPLVDVGPARRPLQ
jgi:hypothetical protein